MEDRKALIQKYNEQHGTACTSITAIYNRENSAAKAGKKLKVDERTIRNWVLAEGGKLNPRGGYRPKRKPDLKARLAEINPALLKMPVKALAAYMGCSRSWCSVVLRRR